MPGVTSRTLHIVRAIANSPTPMGVTDIVRITNIPKTTVHRIVNVLKDEGVVIKEGRRYRLSPTLNFHQTGNAHWVRLGKVMRPYLTELHQTTKHMTSLATVVGGKAHYLDAMYPRQMTDVILRTAPEAPLHCTAVGKVLLAFNPDLIADYLRRPHLARLTEHSIGDPLILDQAIAEARLRSVAIESQEHLPGFVSIAAPVLNPQGRAVAALSIAGALQRFDPRRHVGELKRTAHIASRAVHHYFK